MEHVLEPLHVPGPVAAHGLSVVDNKDVHPGAVVESCEELRGEEEILGAGLVTGGSDQQVEPQPLIPSIHPLVDLVHTPA